MNFTSWLKQVVAEWKDTRSVLVARQTGILYGSRLLVLLARVVAASLVTRSLGPNQYGDLSFVKSFILFSGLFFDMGVFDTSSKLLANTARRDAQRYLTGGLLVLSLFTALAFTIFSLLASFWVDSVFGTSVNTVVRLVAPLAAAYLVQSVLERICMGLNRVKLAFTLRVLPAVWYLVGILILKAVAAVNIQTVLLANLTGIWIAVLYVAYKVRPSFANLKMGLRESISDIRDYGFKVFSGRVLNNAARQSAQLIIGLFDSTASVGFYSLALMIVQPIVLFPQSLSYSMYRGFASEPRIPRRTMVVVAVWLLSSSAALALFGRPIVEILLSREFDAVVPLMSLAIAGSALAGFTQPLNAYLGANGQGDYIRTAALVTAIYDVLANLTLIYLFGAFGAVYSYVGERAVSLAIRLYFYRRLLRNRASVENR